MEKSIQVAREAVQTVSFMNSLFLFYPDFCIVLEY